MLVLRTAVRSRLGINVIKLPVRYYRSTQPRLYQPFLKPYTWKDWAFYRPDGSLRSKLKGTLLTLMAGGACLILGMRKVTRELSIKCYAYQVLVCIQRLDTEYASHDFSNPSDVVSYFRRLLLSYPNFGNVSVEAIAPTVRHVIDADEEAHKALRECFEEMHAIISQGREQDPLETASALMKIINHSLGRFLQVAEQVKQRQKNKNVIPDPVPDGDDSYGIVG